MLEKLRKLSEKFWTGPFFYETKFQRKRFFVYLVIVFLTVGVFIAIVVDLIKTAIGVF